MQLEVVDALRHTGVRARQKARAHAIGDGAEPQIEARRLHLAVGKGRSDPDMALGRKLRDRAIGQNAAARAVEPLRQVVVLIGPSTAHSRASGNPALGPRFRGDERRDESLGL